MIPGDWPTFLIGLLGLCIVGLAFWILAKVIRDENK